jgi:hypothetical protein
VGCSGSLPIGLETSDFDAQMFGTKFWKGDEHIRTVYKKPFSLVPTEEVVSKNKKNLC